MRIQEAVRSTLVGAAVSMNLTHGNHKSVRIEEDRISQDGSASTTIPLTVGLQEQCLAYIHGRRHSALQRATCHIIHISGTRSILALNESRAILRSSGARTAWLSTEQGWRAIETVTIPVKFR